MKKGPTFMMLDCKRSNISSMRSISEIIMVGYAVTNAENYKF